MRCKSCDASMSDIEAQTVIHTTEDGVDIFSDWCYTCNLTYGTWEAQSQLDTRTYQFHDLTEDGNYFGQ